MPTTSPFDPCTCSLCELTQHVRDTHHAYLKTELPLIWDLLRKAAATGRPAAAEVRAFAAVFGRFRSELENHLRKEEEVLFPMIERLDHAVRSGDRPPRHPFGPLALPIEVLEAEHGLGDRLLDRMRPMWQRWTVDADAPPYQRHLEARLQRLDADMRTHVHVEDAILFPRTIGLEGRPWPVSVA